MKVSQASPPQGRFDQVFQMASEATGTSFEYLLATAKRESSLRPDLKASTSSATGLFQFVEQTWLSMVKEEGEDLGLSSFANAITVDARGRASVADPAMRQQILDLRKDPTLSSIMAGRLTQKNASQLERALGRPPSDGELYIAHFLGPSGANRLIGLANQDPLASAAKAFPKAAEANRPIFFDKDGRARGAAEVYTELVARHPDQIRQAVPASPAAEVAASRVAVAFSALPEGAVAAARQPLAPGFDAFRAKARGEPFTARTASASDPFKAVLKPDSSAATVSDETVPAIDTALGYANTPSIPPRSLPPPSVPSSAPAATPNAMMPSAMPEARRSRLVTDPASWGAAEARSTGVIPHPAPARPQAPVGVNAATRAQPSAVAPQRPAMDPAAAPARVAAASAGIAAAATGPAHANRSLGRTQADARPLDLTGFLSYRVPREPKDIVPPM